MAATELRITSTGLLLEMDLSGSAPAGSCVAFMVSRVESDDDPVGLVVACPWP
jgi:hypothetical protein